MLSAPPLALDDLQRSNIVPALPVELVKLAQRAFNELSCNADRGNNPTPVTVNVKQSFFNFGFRRISDKAIHVSPRNCLAFRVLSHCLSECKTSNMDGVSE